MGMQRRVGAMPKPVMPDGAVVETVDPFDPLALGRASLSLRRPRCRRLLEIEFGLTRKQSYSVCVHTGRRRSIRGELWLALGRYWGACAIGVLVVGLLAGLPMWSGVVAWSSARPVDDPLAFWALVGGLALLGLVLVLGLLAAERWIVDPIVEREIRRCWGDQECLWCSRDMAGCEVDQQRWARCPECGLRSPIAARASTI